MPAAAYGNFGLDLPDGPPYVSMPAFPPGPERDWVAYGSGVHAVSGLGDVGGLLERRPVCDRELLHPGPIFQPKQNVF